jgi:glutathione synthase/RimK-type ligase-like ATP-grasp enzyme
VKVGLLWRAEWDPPGPGPVKLHGVFDAFAALGRPSRGGRLVRRSHRGNAAIVLKQRRGMGGHGVWKAEPGGELLRVQHAVRGGYVLCEINASSTFAFPEHAMRAVAQAAIDRICERS